MKKLISCFLFLFLVIGCSSPNRGSIDNATILNWENEFVTMEQFVSDHKRCLGIDRPAHMPRSRIAKLLSPNASGQMPNWEGLWVTFSANDGNEVGGRSLMSVPPGVSSKSVGAYRKCMFGKGYLLRAS